MGFMDGKVVAIFGVANQRSIAWGITRSLIEQGATVALNYQNDRMKQGVDKLVAELPKPLWTAPCDVTDEAQVEAFFDALGKEFGHLDGLVHSVAFAKREELGGHFSDTSWEGFQLAHHISAYSLIPLAKQGAKLMEGRGGSIVCLSYYGAEKVIEGYNIMGVAKASLEASTRYLAADLGERGIRVNAVSAGPLKTISAMGISGFSGVLDQVAQKAPLRRNVTQEEVGDAATFLLSHLARGITGQTIYVDSGYSIVGA